MKVETRGSGIGVTIQDDGKGFGLRPIEVGHGHFGFSAMRERAEMAGGIFDVRSEPGKGVTVEFWLPSEVADLPEQAAPEDM